MAKIKIIIADDHPMIRQGIKQILELENDFDVVALACNGDEAVKLFKQISPITHGHQHATPTASKLFCEAQGREAPQGF